MAKAHYTNKFMIVSTNGEAEEFFGKNLMDLPASKRPRLKIKVGRDNCVKFKVLHAPKSVKVKFGDIADGRFLGSDHVKWPNEGTGTDVIIGDIYRDDPERHQLFVMWVKANRKAKTKKDKLVLGFYFFENDCRISRGASSTLDLCECGSGQQAGGGTGTGPH